MPKECRLALVIGMYSKDVLKYPKLSGRQLNQVRKCDSDVVLSQKSSDYLCTSAGDELMASSQPRRTCAASRPTSWPARFLFGALRLGEICAHDPFLVFSQVARARVCVFHHVRESRDSLFVDFRLFLYFKTPRGRTTKSSTFSPGYV